MNVKIAVSIMISFAIAFSVLFLVALLYNNANSNALPAPNESLKFVNKTLVGNLQNDRGGALQLESIFFSKPVTNEKKIFILGSSEVKAINTTQVQEYLGHNGINYTVYNLATPADRPEARWYTNSLDLIVASNPDVILYGISYRDFMNDLPNANLNKPTNTPLPDPSVLLPELYSKIRQTTHYDSQALDNPKLATLSIIKYEGRKMLGLKNPAIGNDLADLIPYPNALFKTSVADRTTLTDQQLKAYFFVHGVTFNGISDPENNIQIISFEKTMSKLKQHNVKIVIFTTPKSKYYLDSMPISEKKHFDSIVKNISAKYDAKLYSTLWDKYQDLVLWSDPTHVAINHDGLIYGTDIAKIILNETRP